MYTFAEGTSSERNWIAAQCKNAARPLDTIGFLLLQITIYAVYDPEEEKMQYCRKTVFGRFKPVDTNADFSEKYVILREEEYVSNQQELNEAGITAGSQSVRPH